MYCIVELIKLAYNSIRAILVVDYIDEVLQEDEDREPHREETDGGITFTAKSPRRYSA